MTDARISRAFPDLPEPLALVALLGETLDMARGMQLSRDDIAAAGADAGQVADLIARTGLLEEIDAAERTTTSTIVELLARVSERDLEEGRDQGLLSPEDFREALSAKRRMSLARDRAVEREDDRQR